MGEVPCRVRCSACRTQHLKGQSSYRKVETSSWRARTVCVRWGEYVETEKRPFYAATSRHRRVTPWEPGVFVGNGVSVSSRGRRPTLRHCSFDLCHHAPLHFRTRPHHPPHPQDLQAKRGYKVSICFLFRTLSSYASRGGVGGNKTFGLHSTAAAFSFCSDVVVKGSIPRSPRRSSPSLLRAARVRNPTRYP